MRRSRSRVLKTLNRELLLKNKKSLKKYFEIQHCVENCPFKRINMTTVCRLHMHKIIDASESNHAFIISFLASIKKRVTLGCVFVFTLMLRAASCTCEVSNMFLENVDSIFCAAN